MKPEAPAPNLNPELPSIEYGLGSEGLPAMPSPEQGVEKAAERVEQQAEMSAIATDISSVSVAPVAPTNVNNVAKNTIVGETPPIANDDDLIEKEWVDKAKKIVADTKDDPYKREEAASILQIDYIKKRWGREIGTAE